MLDGHIFFSYPRSHEAEIDAVVRYLKDVLGDRLWFDQHINVGDFEQQIEQKISSACGMIVIMTADSVGPRSSGWIEKEIEIAVDCGMQTILPVVVGDFLLPDELSIKVKRFQRLQVSEITKLRDSGDFRRHAKYFRDLLEGKVQAEAGGGRPLNNAPAAWFAGQPDIAAIALSLTVAVLENAPTNPVLDLAKDLERRLEAELRPKTEEEVNADPRKLDLTTSIDRMRAARAERGDALDVEGNVHRDVIRFVDRSYGPALLKHVWNEVEMVRAVLLDWMKEMLESRDRQEIGEQVAQAFGVFAQHDFTAIRYRFLDEWLADLDGIDKRLSAVETIVAAAVEIPENARYVERLLNELSDGTFIHRMVAAHLALGPVGLRRPSLGTGVLRKLGPMTFENQMMRELIQSRPAIRGVRLDVEEIRNRSEWFVREDAEDAPTSESSGEADAAKAQAEAVSFALDSEEEDLHRSAARAIPAADFLAALGNWANEKVSEQRGLRRRQIPLYWLLTGLERMPLYTTELQTRRLTLEDLVGEISEREPATYAAIIDGVVRALRANPIAKAGYPARLHVQLVLRAFAEKRYRATRRDSDTRIPTPELDPYILFTNRIHRAMADLDACQAPLVYERSGQFINADDIARIRDPDFPPKPKSPSPKETPS